MLGKMYNRARINSMLEYQKSRDLRQKLDSKIIRALKSYDNKCNKNRFVSYTFIYF